MASEPNVVKEGLLKQYVETMFSKWKPCYVRLLPDSIELFDAKMQRKIQVLRLTYTYSVIPSQEGAFAFEISNSKVSFIFMAASQSEQWGWTEALNRSFSRLKMLQKASRLSSSTITMSITSNPVLNEDDEGKMMEMKRERKEKRRERKKRKKKRKVNDEIDLEKGGDEITIEEGEMSDTSSVCSDFSQTSSIVDFNEEEGENSDEEKVQVVDVKALLVEEETSNEINEPPTITPEIAITPKLATDSSRDSSTPKLALMGFSMVGEKEEEVKEKEEEEDLKVDKKMEDLKEEEEIVLLPTDHLCDEESSLLSHLYSHKTGQFRISKVSSSCGRLVRLEGELGVKFDWGKETTSHPTQEASKIQNEDSTMVDRSSANLADDSSGIEDGEGGGDEDWVMVHENSGRVEARCIVSQRLGKTLSILEDLTTPLSTTPITFPYSSQVSIHDIPEEEKERGNKIENAQTGSTAKIKSEPTVSSQQNESKAEIEHGESDHGFIWDRNDVKEGGRLSVLLTIFQPSLHQHQLNETPVISII